MSSRARTVVSAFEWAAAGRQAARGNCQLEVVAALTRELPYLTLARRQDQDPGEPVVHARSPPAFAPHSCASTTSVTRSVNRRDRAARALVASARRPRSSIAAFRGAGVQARRSSPQGISVARHLGRLVAVEVGRRRLRVRRRRIERARGRPRRWSPSRRSGRRSTSSTAWPIGSPAPRSEAEARGNTSAARSGSARSKPGTPTATGAERTVGEASHEASPSEHKCALAAAPQRA